jgi:hypothetical protein
MLRADRLSDRQTIMDDLISAPGHAALPREIEPVIAILGLSVCWSDAVFGAAARAATPRTRSRPLAAGGR